MQHKIHEDEIQIAKLDNGACHIEISPKGDNKITIRDALEKYCKDGQGISDGKIERLKKNWKGNVVTFHL